MQQPDARDLTKRLTFDAVQSAAALMLAAASQAPQIGETSA